MTYKLPLQSASVFRQRQQRLQAAMDDTALSAKLVVIEAGGPRPRNYHGSTFPFRADSSFLYLVGASLPGAAIGFAQGKSTLYVPELPKNDALWHGESPRAEQVAQATGVDAWAFRAELDRELAGRDPQSVAVLPCTDPVTRLRQAQRLGRDWPERGDVYAPSGDDKQLMELMIALRLRHDAAGIEQMKQAAEITAAGHRAAMGATAVGKREYHIQSTLVQAFGQHAACEAYGSIVTVHGEVLHNFDYSHPLEDGDLLLADAGAEFDGWASDVTRTWPVNGRFSPTQKAIYEIVLQAELDGIAKVRAGTRYQEVHLTCARTLTRGLVDLGIFSGDVDSLVERGAHALFFPHGAGHLIGLDVHDMENFGDLAGYAPGRSRSEQFGLGYLRLDRDLEPGMAVTVEPGFYQVPALLQGSELVRGLEADKILNREALQRYADVRGIRIEDDVLCTQGEPEVLSGGLQKQVAEIEALVGTAP